MPIEIRLWCSECGDDIASDVYEAHEAEKVVQSLIEYNDGYIDTCASCRREEKIMGNEKLKESFRDVIMYMSFLNCERGCPIYKQCTEEDNPRDCVVIYLKRIYNEKWGE